MQRTDWSAHGIELTHTISEHAPHAIHRARETDDVVRLHIGLRGVGGHHNVLYAPAFELEFAAKTPVIETFGVRFPVERFIEYADGANASLSRFCERIARMEPSVLFDRFGPMTPALEGTIREILASRYHGRLQELFVLSKAIERIIAARDRLNERLTEPPTLPETSTGTAPARAARRAQRVQAQARLQGGVRQDRLRVPDGATPRARAPLSSRHVADRREIAAELGYATPQHFHAAFKKHFGVTPNSMRKTP